MEKIILNYINKSNNIIISDNLLITYRNFDKEIYTIFNIHLNTTLKNYNIVISPFTEIPLFDLINISKLNQFKTIKLKLKYLKKIVFFHIVKTQNLKKFVEFKNVIKYLDDSLKIYEKNN